MSNWHMFGDVDGFVRLHHNADGRPWYQVVRILWPEDTDDLYMVRGGTVNASMLGRRNMKRIINANGLSISDICKLDGCSVAWLIADSGMMEVDLDMPHITTDDASEFIGTLNKYGIHDLDGIAG